MAIDFTQVTSDKSFVSFSNEFRKNDYLIVELPDDIQKDLNNGEKIFIKGQHSASASLCTDSHSSLLQKVSTSNTILLCEDGMKELHNNVIVQGQVSSQIELINNPIDPSSILQVLSSVSEKNGTPLQTIWHRTTYCKKQLERFLSTYLHCVHDENDEWFLITHQLVYEYYEKIYSSILQHNLSLSSFSKQQVLSSFQEQERCIASQLFDKITIQNTQDADVEMDGSSTGQRDDYALNQSVITKIIARQLFINEQNNSIPYESFVSKLSVELPSLFTFNESDLQDIVIRETNDSTDVVLFIDTYSLPTTPYERYVALFHIRNEWTPSQLHPFVADLESWGFGKVHDMNTKYCREVKMQDKNKELYSILVLKQ